MLFYVILFWVLSAILVPGLCNIYIYICLYIYWMKWVLYGHRKGSVLDDSWPMAYGTKNGTLDSDRLFCRSIFFTKIIFSCAKLKSIWLMAKATLFLKHQWFQPGTQNYNMVITCQWLKCIMIIQDRIAAFFTLFQRSYSWKPCHHEVQNIRDVIPFPRYPGHILSIRWIIGNWRVVVFGFTAALMDGSWPNSIIKPSGL